tara:strand:- start:2085 stop:3251 length:1167 start_codon:yes stop_codon:yes gene_type:complete
MNKKIIAVSGYFDPIHVGHLEYLNEASKLGDELHVIVNNDFQASLKKGKSFMNQHDRLEIVKNLKIVDKVILSIDEDMSVKKTLKQIKPNIFANGGDQFQGAILEEEVCKENNIQIIDGLGKKIRSSSKFTGIGLERDSNTPPILTLIIPVYNEKDNIVSLLNNIKNSIKIPISVSIIYDDISDNTLPVVNEVIEKYDFPILLVQNKYGSGALNAIKTGLQSFSSDACVVIMADGSDDLSSINGMYGLFCQGFHIVCGSRYMKNGKQTGGPIFKKLLSKTAGKSLFYLTGLPTSDVTNSFKLYSKECIDSITFESSGGFEIGMEIVVKSYLNGFAISEVPTFWKDRFEGTSNFKLRQWLPYYLRWYVKILFSKKPREIRYNNIRKVGY